MPVYACFHALKKPGTIVGVLSIMLFGIKKLSFLLLFVTNKWQKLFPLVI